MTMADGDDGHVAADEAFTRHIATHGPVSDCPLHPGAFVTLLPGGAETFDAIFAAIESARTTLLMEYYEFENVEWHGRHLLDVLCEKLAQGVRLALSYDAAGCQNTPDSDFDRLRSARAELLEYRPLNPFRRRFNPLQLNDRDHRKILIVDQRLAFLGGVNLTRAYLNPREAGAPPDPSKAFWYDATVRIEGSPLPEIVKLFFHSWHKQGGPHIALPAQVPAAPPEAQPRPGEIVRVDGSAPRARRQLYFESLKAALAAARSRVLLATGYFVPTMAQWHLLAQAASRGVTVDLILPGYSDLPSCVHAARALYGPLLRRGVRIHEITNGMLHAKVATIDGVWTAIGSSNLDRRSFVYNNEVDAIGTGPQHRGRRRDDVARLDVRRRTHHAGGVAVPVHARTPERARRTIVEPLHVAA